MHNIIKIDQKSIINQKSIHINKLNEFTHAQRRNDFSDATQPICLEDYAEIIATNHPRSSHRERSRLVTVEVKGQPR